ncbi:ABC transporter permease [Mangrovimonas futianensis]|uniref:ABC transporter permease n=1 Tax=Mangrovimonas futianensis TaxID=2895523 RepID=UPI001E3E8A18|nr:ABC transporter permease [Mangrovimonas futianensis]MCF1420263.1 ABC transporter permease [Mangrovimonas futianensis]
MQIKKYTSSQNSQSFKGLFVEMFQDLMASRGLAWRLTVRDFKGQYRQSFFGAFWVFITPLMSALVWMFLNASGAVKISSSGIPYPAYVLTGTMLWSILSESINMPLKQTNASKGVISKINFPKEALLLSGLYKIGGNTLIKIGLILLVLLVFGVVPDYKILLLPLVLTGFILFGFSIGLLLTPIGMLYNDVVRLIPMAMQFLMYLSPVVYSMPKDQSLLTQIIRINPTTCLINLARNSFVGLPFEQWFYFGVLMFMTIIIMLVSWVFYRYSIPIIVERNS